MITIEASVPCTAPPAWAVLERRLFEIMDRSVYPFLAKYTRDDSTLIWRDRMSGRDGADDFYESFHNWPLLYLLGGGDHLLELGDRQWDAVTRQLTSLGLVRDEYELGYDQFHQSESCIYFYLLCLADPTNPKLIDRARRFAGLFIGDDPSVENYDPVHKLIRAPHNGSGGPRPRTDPDPKYGWSPGMARYGLPYEDVPGVNAIEDLKDPELARRMGRALQDRMSWGDVVANLGVTSLVTNAQLLTGEAQYRDWLLEYVGAWSGRAKANGGLIPDNVGLSGQVGEYIDGKWYGGLYGWSWPHGYYNIGMATVVAGCNAFLLSRDPSYLDLPRAQIDHVMSLGKLLDVESLEMSLTEHWDGVFGAMEKDQQAFVIPYRYADSGWFDYQPPSVIYPTALWNLSQADADWRRIESIREASGYDWQRVVPFRTKEDAGHEAPWLRFLAGDNPSYPEAILSESYGQVCRRMEQIRRDRADLQKVHIHHWQQLNPVITEALVQLTLGAPQIVYNGGLLMVPLRYYDAERSRPGLPQDVAALVMQRDAEKVTVQLVNTSPQDARDVIVQAGGFAEHRFLKAAYSERTSEYPGPVGTKTWPPLTTECREKVIDDAHVHVHLAPATQITLELSTARFANEPSYALPW